MGSKSEKNETKLRKFKFMFCKEWHHFGIIMKSDIIEVGRHYFTLYTFIIFVLAASGVRITVVKRTLYTNSSFCNDIPCLET